MKCKRNIWSDITWTRWDKSQKLYTRKFWKQICPYKKQFRTRWKMCIKAAKLTQN